MIKKLTLVLACALILSACGAAKTTSNITKTPEPQTGGVLDIANKDKPYISLIPTNDGHWLDLKMNKVPSYISSIEYEMTYNSVDNGNEIEKGVSGTIRSPDITASIDRKLLLGTESCTAGCKYKYDDGVVGGNLSINFISQDGKTATYASDFKLNKVGKTYNVTLQNFDGEASTFKGTTQ